MLLGTFTLRLDEKGRFFLPAKWRSELAEGVVMMPGQDHCVYLWTEAEFDRRTAELAAAPVSSRQVRRRSRSVFADVHSDAPDKQGRVTMTPALREWAGLDKDCVVLGLRSRIEIWDPSAWERYQAEAEQDFADLDTEEVVSGI